MIHPSRKGIYCDLCGKEVLISKEEITYYTIQMKKVTSRKDIPPDVEDSLDMDFCVECHEKLYDRVHKVSLVNDEKRKNYARIHRSTSGTDNIRPS